MARHAITGRNISDYLYRYYDYLERLQLSGYPVTNPISQHWSPATQRGHKVLISDMPAWINQMDAAIRQLQPYQQAVIMARFKWNRDEENRPITHDEKARRLDMSVSKYKSVWKVAKKQLVANLSRV